jgi:cell division protein FtsQ
MAVRRRPLRLVAILLAALAALALAGWVLGFSPLFAVRTVTVTGLTDAGERAAARDAAGVTLGTPLARVDTGGAAARIGGIATVDSAQVSRSWPSTITVTVHRKVPVLAVRNPQGQLQVVDGNGVPFQTVAQAPSGVAVVNATTAAPDPEGLRAALSALRLLPPAQRSTVADVTVTSADLVAFRLGATTVVWGGVEDGPKKVAVLGALLRTNPVIVDVSAPDTPVTR